MTRQRGVCKRGGFTLIEILVAMVVGGVALGAAAALFVDLAGRDEAIRDSAVTSDHHWNGHLLLERLFLNADVRTGIAAPFRGDSVEMAFVSWCGEYATTMQRCRADLHLRSSGPGAELLLVVAARTRGAAEESDSLLLRTVSHGAFRYLIDVANGGIWVTSWERAQPPAAVAVVLDGDTLILAVGSHD